MGFPHLFGMPEDEIDPSAFQRHLQADQSMRSAPNQASLPNAFHHQFTQGQQGNSLLQQSIFPQQTQQQQQPQGMGGGQPGALNNNNNNNNAAMMQQMMEQSFGSTGNSLFGRFGAGLTDSQQQQQNQQQQFFGGASLLDSFSPHQQGGIQPNLQELLNAQRRISLGLGGGGGGGGSGGNAATLQQQLHNMNGGNMGGGNSMFNDFSKNFAAAGLDPFQGGSDGSNFEGLMASQLQQQQQQQQQLSWQQQLMMMTSQQQGDNVRRNSFGGSGMGGGFGGMDPTLSMQLSLMGQQPQQQQQHQQPPMTLGVDMSSSQLGALQRSQLEEDDNPVDPDETESLEAKALSAALPSDEGKKPRKKKAKTFPEKLMQAITGHGEEGAVAWLPDGKSFVIVNDDLFVDQVLNKVFKESKYTSFVRKLHRWGFVRLTSGTGTDCFHHPLFQRGRRDLANKITCTPRDKDGNLKTPHRNMKPPSLAGVERFIRQKADAAVAMAEAKARHRDSDPYDSVPLQTPSGMPGVGGVQPGGVPSQLVMEGMEKSPEPIGLGVYGMTSNLAMPTDMRKEMVKSMEDDQGGSLFRSGLAPGEIADV